MSDTEDLTGPVYFQDEVTGEVQMADQSQCRDCAVGEPHACRYLTPGPGVRRVLVTPVEPEPALTPPLPWVEHPNTWWQDANELTQVYPSVDMDMNFYDPSRWRRVAVIPQDLIERLRVEQQNSAAPGEFLSSLGIAARAVGDAADGAS